MIFKEICFTKTRLDNQDAVKVVQRTMRYDSEITLEHGTRKINAKSIMGIVSMGLKGGDKLTVFAAGDDEKAAVEDIAALLTGMEG